MLGYLVLTAQPAILNTHCGTEFITPSNLGIHLSMPGLAPTAAIFSKLVRTHKHQVRLFNEYHAVDLTCNKFISKLIPEKFYMSLSIRIIGFAKVTSLEILNHFLTKYAKLEEEDVKDIDQKMKEPISSENLFGEFVKKIEWIQEVVAVQNPYSPAQIVSMAYTNIEKCGLYQNDCREWSLKTQSDKTWSNFKAHFARAFKETRRTSRTSNNEGYAAHVHAAQANAALFTEMQQNHTLALENLATATQADRTSVALPTKTILELSIQVAHLTAKIATAQAENARMKKSGHQSTTSGHGHRAFSNSTPPDPTSSQDRNVYSRSGQRFDPNRYFSPQVYKVEESHTSATCCFPSNGHSKSAKQIYIKGGKTWNKEWINGGPTKWGGSGLDKDIVNINENYINYIQSRATHTRPMGPWQQKNTF